MFMQYWRRWFTRFDVWSLRFVKDQRGDVETVLRIVENFNPKTIGDINTHQMLNASITSVAISVTSSCAIWRQAALDLESGQRVTNTLAEIRTTHVSPARYFLSSTMSFVDYVAVLTDSREALLKILQYMSKHSTSNETDAVMNCRAIEQQLPSIYRYVTSLMTTAIAGPLRK